MQFKLSKQQFLWTWHFRMLLPLLLFILISLKPAAQVITIDGHATDWAGKTYNAYSHDKNNSHDNQFTQGAKDGDAIANWHWSDGSTNNKGDITNGAAILGTEMVGGVSHNFLYFAGDRAVNNGDAAIGFWFFKGGVTMDTTSGPDAGGDYAGVFSGVHQDGDLLVVSHFTQGGGQADIFVYKWQGTGLLAPVTSSTAAVNSGSENVPTGFSYASGSYPIGDFFEGKVDLTNLGVAPCFTNFLLETRNSQSITASLQDLTFGSFTLSVGAPTTTGAARCGPGSVTLNASGCTGGTLKWYDAATGGNLVNTGASYTVSITTTTTFYVSCTSAEGCISGRTAVTGTINGNPTVSASATPAGPVNIGTAPPHYSLSTTVNGTVNNSGFNYSWVQDPTTGGSLSSTTIPNPTFTATIGGTYTWTVTATDKSTSCSNTATVSRVISPLAGCPLVPRSPVCQGTTHTYTADVGPAAYETWTWSVNNGAVIVSVANGGIANGGQSIKVTAGTQNFTLTLTKKYANTSLPDQVCNYPITVNPLATAPDVTYVGPACTETTFKVTVNNPEVGSTYTLTQLDNNVVTIGPYVSGTLQFTGLHVGQGYSVQAQTAAGCKSNFNDCGTFTHSSTARVAPTTLVAPTAEEPTVIAAPNPFNDRVRFSVKSPLSGQGSLELYNMLGQKVKVIYQGTIQKGVQTFEYVVPGAQRANLIYIFRVGTYKVSGKLINLKS